MTSKSFRFGCVKFIKDHAVGIKTMLIRHIRRKHLVVVEGGKVGDLLLGFKIFTLGKRRKNRTISTATSNTIFAWLRSAAQPYTSARSSPSPHRSRSATAAASSDLPLFLRYLNVRRVELPVVNTPNRSE